MTMTDADDLFADWEELAVQAEEVPDFMIDGLIHAQTNIISGKPSAGKTRFVAGIAAAVARGDEKFCGQHVSRKGRVRVLSTDAGEATRWGLRMDELGAPRGTGAVKAGRFRPDMWPIYQELCRDTALLVVDNVNGALRGDESISDDAPARRLCHPLTEIAEAGTTVILLTHSAKNYEAASGNRTPTGAMGSTVYEAFSRCTVHIHDVTEPNVRSLLVTSNDYGLRGLLVRADWTRAAAKWSLLEETADKRPRTDETFTARNSLFSEVMAHPEWRTMKNKSELGRALFAARPGEFATDTAARVAFDRARKTAKGEFVAGAWTSSAA